MSRKTLLRVILTANKALYLERGVAGSDAFNIGFRRPCILRFAPCTTASGVQVKPNQNSDKDKVFA